MDCGFADGTDVSVNYDPMLAKLVTHADDREAATHKMERALNEVLFTGLKTNRDYLKRILRHPKYISGDIHTHFIAEEKLTPVELDDDKLALIMAASIFASSKPSLKRNAWDSLLGFRNV